MKLIKINPDHYVIVDDSEIKEGDWFLNIIQKEIYCNDIPNYDVNKKYLKKITHSTQPDKGMENVTFISPRELKELIGEVDVDKKAEEVYPQTYYSGIHIDGFLKAGYVKGYNQALEDNKEKKYTEEDVIRIVEKSRETGLTAEYLLLSIQPKTEWDVEIEMEDSFTKNDEVYVDENNAKGNYYTHSKKPKLDAKGLILKLKSE